MKKSKPTNRNNGKISGKDKSGRFQVGNSFGNGRPKTNPELLERIDLALPAILEKVIAEALKGSFKHQALLIDKRIANLKSIEITQESEIVQPIAFGIAKMREQVSLEKDNPKSKEAEGIASITKPLIDSGCVRCYNG